MAYARVEVREETRQLVVARCPFCGHTHRFGAGSPYEPIVSYLGVRAVDCAPPDYRPQRFDLRLEGEQRRARRAPRGL